MKNDTQLILYLYDQGGWDLYDLYDLAKQGFLAWHDGEGILRVHLRDCPAACLYYKGGELIEEDEVPPRLHFMHYFPYRRRRNSLGKN